MSYSIDANVLLYASDESSPEHARARAFLERRTDDSDLLCSKVGELATGADEWMKRYNTSRPHPLLDNHTQARVYETNRKPAKQKAQTKQAA